MRASHVELDAGTAQGAQDVQGVQAVIERDPIRRFLQVLPRPVRRLGVGGLGLITDLGVFLGAFTPLIDHGVAPLLAQSRHRLGNSVELAERQASVVAHHDIRSYFDYDAARLSDLLTNVGTRLCV